MISAVFSEARCYWLQCPMTWMRMATTPGFSSVSGRDDDVVMFWSFRQCSNVVRADRWSHSTSSTNNGYPHWSERPLHAESPLISASNPQNVWIVHFVWTLRFLEAILVLTCSWSPS